MAVLKVGFRRHEEQCRNVKGLVKEHAHCHKGAEKSVCIAQRKNILQKIQEHSTDGLEERSE